MAVKLHHKGFAHAQMLINAHEVEHNQNGVTWKDSAPTADDSAKFLKTHDIEEYGEWFLGVDTDKPRENKEHYVYPYGDFSEVHRGAVVQAEKEANTQGHQEIAQAAKKLLAMVDAQK